MISDSFIYIGISESWIRKLLPETLKFTKHTRKDYLRQQQQRDQESLQQQTPELVELPVSKVPVLKQEQTSDEEKTKVATYYDDSLAIIPKAQKEDATEESDKDRLIENLKQEVEALQEEIRFLREASTQQQQQQQQEVFIAQGFIKIGNNDTPIKVTVNIKTRTIEYVEIDRDAVKRTLAEHNISNK